MKRADLTEKILDIKREKGWSWKHICEQIGGMSPVMVTGAILGFMGGAGFGPEVRALRFDLRSGRMRESGECE